MMERLTKRFRYYCGLLMGCKHNPKINADVKIDDLKHIQELISAEEQGLFLRLPCKVGDTVYNIWNVDDKLEIQEIKIATLNNLVAHMEYGNFGKTVFLTRDEAEAKLKEMEGRNE